VEGVSEPYWTHEIWAADEVRLKEELAKPHRVGCDCLQCRVHELIEERDRYLTLVCAVGVDLEMDGFVSEDTALAIAGLLKTIEDEDD